VQCVTKVKCCFNFHINNLKLLLKKKIFCVNARCSLHYEKPHSLKPHYLTTKTQKTTHIQLLCNYPLDITITM